METQFALGELTPDNLLQSLDLHPAKMGAERIGRARALAAWRKLVSRREVCKSAVVEQKSFRGTQIVGCGVAVFVKRSFADREATDPQPGLNLRVIESVDSNKSVLASGRELRDDNTQAELQQVILYTNWRSDRLTPGEVVQVRCLLALAYQQVHAGYRMRRMLTELVDEAEIVSACEFHGIQLMSRFLEFFAAHPETSWNLDRALAVTTGETLQREPGSVAHGLFLLHRTPRFRFTLGEQDLLVEALKGADDVDAAKDLYRSFAAIKRRWTTIFEKVDVVLPGFCAPGDGVSRGAQKRHRILTYIREHPEELRPFNDKPLKQDMVRSKSISNLQP